MPVSLSLSFSPPYDWAAMIAFLAARAIPGVEAVESDMYRRSIEIEGAAAGLEIRRDGSEACLWLRVIAPSPPDGAIANIAARARRLFDLDRDPALVARCLGRDDRLRALVRSRPGLRVPGSWSPFEMAVRAILGQQVSVPAASTLAGRLVEAFGAPVVVELRGITHHFPAPARLADAGVERIGIPRARADTIRALASAVSEGSLALDQSEGLDEAVNALTRIKGIGPWTAHYIAMRALGEPDALPAGDLGIRKALARKDAKSSDAEVVRLAEAWRPFRSYAVMHLWMSLASGAAATRR